jgi:hypothetical protein
MTLFKLILSSLLFVNLISCVKADRTSPQSNEEVKFRGSQLLEDNLLAYNNRSLFESGQIQLDDIKFNKLGSSDWKEVNQIQLYLSVCNIKDRASQGTLRNEKFYIKSELGENIFKREDDDSISDTKISNPIKVNSNNCLRWMQNVPFFDFIAPSINIVLHYEIESLSGGLGKNIKRIGFNPWDFYRKGSQSKAFMDLTEFDRQDWYQGQWAIGQDQVIAALKGELIESTAKLEFKSVVIEPIEKEAQRVSDYNKSLENLSKDERKLRDSIDKLLLQKNGFQINVNFSGLPFVRLQNSTDLITPIDITSGRFKVYMNLVASGASEDGKKYLISSNIQDLNGKSTALTWNMTGNGLLASVPMILRNRTELGRLELAVKIEPVSKDLRKIKPFMAVYDLGAYDNWVKRQSTSFKFDEKNQALNDIDYDKYIGSVSGITSDISEVVRKIERFYFGPLTMRFVRIMPGESATDRTLQYTVRSCVENGFTGSRAGRGLQFEIETSDAIRGKYKIRRQTNEDGCLSWFGFLSHKYYRKEVLQKKIAHIKYIGSSSDRDQSDSIVNPFEIDKVYYMNPWDEKFTFGWDELDMEKDYPKQVEEQRKNAPKSQIFIADFKYETMGFRYAIDKYLNLKVKKSILLKAYPFVLKYNSIVYGRNGTEKLRDGVYLMKVALQKDYLDPAAKGVRIYDQGLKDPINLASKKDLSNLSESEKLEYEQRSLEEKVNEDNVGKIPYREVYDEAYDEFSSLNSGHVKSLPQMVYDNGANEVDVDHKLLSEPELKESKKEYITYQTKLVRVLGGMIITPVEFEVDDLRLMRIRNQFFIQLQTIDEHKLRIATAIDQVLSDMYKDGNIESKFEEVFNKLDDIQDLENKIIQTNLDKYEDATIKKQVAEDLVKNKSSLENLKSSLNNIFGLNQFKKDSPEYLKRLELINNRLDRLQEYRDLINDKVNGVTNLSIFRDQKRILINRIMGQLQVDNNQAIEKGQNKIDPEYKNADSDPFLKFYFMDTTIPGQGVLKTILDYKIEKAKDDNNDSQALDLDSLKQLDFTESPLTPSFSFDMLRNDGEHNPELAEDDGKSGLPSRTFVGPLTFVFNSNGSSLRPTDILNENFCSTAFCEEPDVIREKIEKGVSPADIEKTIELNSNNEMVLKGEPIYNSGDSVNKDYENNKFYGYLKDYYGVTVDDLIVKKKKIDEVTKRKLEEGSQIINFTKTMKLKYLLLDESNKESQLKGINHDCAQKIEFSRIGECFTNITSGSDVMSRTEFYSLLNDRKYKSENTVTGGLDGIKLSPDIFYNIAGKDPITESELEKVMTNGWKSPEVGDKLGRKLMHRMCFVLAQNFFKDSYFNKPITGKERFFKTMTLSSMNRRSVGGLENLCHEYVSNMYGGYNENKLPSYYNKDLPLLSSKFPPIVFERKIRAYSTTDRYVYRGGKSLNINLAASFNLSSSHGIKVSTTATYKPWDLFKDFVGMIPVIGTIAKTIAGGASISRSTNQDDSAGRTEGINVSSGTFLVSQQATFDIELGEYERCMVARLHPALIKDFMRESSVFANNTFLKNNFNDDTDIESQGILICTGKREKKCLPIKEKYYYFTQHFTEGDMLDTADLHNHPWLLQLRGYRDFQAFTSLIGAREVDYIDDNDWLKSVATRTMNDAAAGLEGMDGQRDGNKTPEFEIVNKESDINWPLEELSRTYFEVLPTFPGFYTFMNEENIDKSDFPHENTNPGSSFRKCEQ